MSNTYLLVALKLFDLCGGWNQQSTNAAHCVAQAPLLDLPHRYVWEDAGKESI